MTNKSVVIINILKVPKIKKILLYAMKFLVQNYSCLKKTEFVNPPPPTKFLGTPLRCIKYAFSVSLVDL